MKNVESFYPLSPMQQGMFFHSLYAPQSGVYVESFSCVLTGRLNVPAFRQTWQRLIERHAVLRTSFTGDGLKEPVQVVQRVVELPLREQDWRELPPAEQQARLETLLDSERRQGFELSKPPLMRLWLLQLADESHQFVWLYHHMLLDGWSMPLILQEFMFLYEAYATNQTPQLPPTPRPYRDYIVWLKQQDLSKAEQFWREMLRGFTAPTPLVIDEHSTAVDDQTEAYQELETHLSKEHTAALQALARQHQLTVSTIVQGVWALLLGRYSGEEEVVFGATVSGRPPELPGSETMVGLFINTLPVRVRIPAETPVLEWLKQLQTQLVEMRQYEFSPLVQIQSWSDVPHGTPLFESIIVFENYPVDPATQEQGGSLTFQAITSIEQTNYPLTVVSGPGETLSLKILFDLRRFEPAAIERMLGHFHTLLAGLATKPDQLLATLPLLTATEKQQILVDWNQTEADFPHERCAHQIFEQTAARWPDTIAVNFEGQTLTYDALNRRANQLAHYLQGHGVGPETLVAICVERSLEMIVGVLGVLKAGGAYVPLDPEYPVERLTFMLADTQAPILLTQKRLLSQLPSLVNGGDQSAQVICLDTDWTNISLESEDTLPSRATSRNLAYIIYTSGSTGRPKGTLLEHRGLCNLITAYTRNFQLGPGNRLMQFFSFGFDGSVADIFPTLLSGATLCLPRRETLLSMPDLHRYMQQYQVTHLLMTPSMLAALPADELPAVQTVLMAGERCTGQIVTRWSSSGRRLINAYGPTEATVASTWFEINDGAAEESSIPIGRPLANVRCYILDKNRQPVPVGVPGELYVGGMGVGRGYLNRPELTAERFIQNPFSQNLEDRLYKTGDLVRYGADGNIEFLGRLDHQIKLRGYRIELGEIETSLTHHPSVQECVVLVREDTPGNKQLVAYIAPVATAQDNGALLTPEKLRAYLQKQLPQYMIPAKFVILETFPLTPNGKVNRRALPAPDETRSVSAETFVAPRDEIESKVVQIWEEILETKPIGITDNFFELGGHSLLAIRLVAQIKQQLDYDLSLATLFQQGTIERLAAVMRYGQPAEEGGSDSLVEIQPHGNKAPLYFIHPSGGSVHWYTDLAHRLGEDQPFYGLQARGLHGDQPIHTRIEDMAAHYVEEIRAFQPEGPYHLGSWSFGVIVAFEAAQQLVAQGQEIALLAILDQGPVLPQSEPEDFAAYLLDVFGPQLPALSLARLREFHEPDEQVAYVFEEAKRIDWIFPEVTFGQFRHFVHTLKTHTEAWRHYTPRPYPGKITLFQASEPTQETAANILGQVAKTIRSKARRYMRTFSKSNTALSDMGWGELAMGGVEIYETPGDHISMIHEPDVQVLAKKLKECLEQIYLPVSNEETIPTP